MLLQGRTRKRRLIPVELRKSTCQHSQVRKATEIPKNQAVTREIVKGCFEKGLDLIKAADLIISKQDRFWREPIGNDTDFQNSFKKDQP